MKCPVARISPVNFIRSRNIRAQEKPRPSRKMGNSTTMSDRRCTSSPNASGDSADLRITPSGALRARNVSRSLVKRVSETIAAPSGSAASSATAVNVSAVNAPSLMSGMGLFQIGHVLERLHADTAIGVEEAFVLVAQLEVRVDYAFDGGADIARSEARAHNVANAGI